MYTVSHTRLFPTYGHTLLTTSISDDGTSLFTLTTPTSIPSSNVIAFKFNSLGPWFSSKTGTKVSRSTTRMLVGEIQYPFPHIPVQKKTKALTFEPMDHDGSATSLSAWHNSGVSSVRKWTLLWMIQHICFSSSICCQKAWDSVAYVLHFSTC